MTGVGFLCKRGKPEASALARSLVPLVRARGLEALVSADQEALVPEARALPAEELAASVDLLVVLGGDGTLLNGAALVGERPVPVLGINLGRLGFLTPFDPAEATVALEGALDGKLAIEERMRTCVALRRADGAVIERLALNDAVISHGEVARIVELVASLDGRRVTVFKSDGLIVCTPTGSTAYNLAAGGPILVPWQSAMAVTPICPHTLTNRPLVVPGSAVVAIELQGQGAGQGQLETPSVVLTVDGQWAHPLVAGDRVEISRAEAPLRLYRSERSYFEILRQKLNWGEREARG